MINDEHRDENVSLLRCLDVPLIKKSVLSALSLGLLFVIQPELSLRQSISCKRERYVSAVDKERYTWMTSEYKWYSHRALDKAAKHGNNLCITVYIIHTIHNIHIYVNTYTHKAYHFRRYVFTFRYN